MKTDLQLQQEVMAELAWEPAVHAAQIGVDVNDGVVTLAGKVSSYVEKCRAERAAQRGYGVLSQRHRQVIAAIALLLSTHAWGTSIGSAHMTLQVELVDLDPLDGIAPWVSFSDRTNSSNYLGVVAFQRDPYALDRVNLDGGQTWVPTAAVASTDFATAALRVESAGTAHGSTLTATAATMEFEQHPSDTAFATAYVRASSLLTLSPNTRLVVTGIGNLSAAGSRYRDTMYLYAGLLLFRLSSSGGTANSWDEARFTSPIYAPGYDHSDDFALTTFLVNASALPMAGNLIASVEATATPIPEPRTLDLMFLGLGVFGVLLHRRSRALGAAAISPRDHRPPTA